MALTFPKNPVVGQIYDYPPFRYQFDGVAWLTVGKGAETVSESIKAHEQAPAIHSMAGIDWQGQVGRRNLVINGDFSVSERLTQGALIATGAYGIDRWWVHGPDCRTYLDAVPVRGIKDGRNVFYVIPATATIVEFSQRIEPSTVQHLVGKTVTLSVDVYTDAGATSASLRMWKRASIDGAWQRIYTENINVTSDIQRFSMTRTLTHDDVVFGIAVGIGTNATFPAGKYFAISNVQLEEGSVATPMEHRFYGEELALCRRYWRKVRMALATSIWTTIFHDGMRVSPSKSWVNHSGAGGTVTYADETLDSTSVKLENFNVAASLTFTLDAEL